MWILERETLPSLLMQKVQTILEGGRMSIEKIAQYDDDRGLPMLEAIREANRKGLYIPSSKELSERLVNSDLWKSEKEMYPCRSGTLCIYETKDTPFGKTVEWEGLVANIPKKFQGQSNMVILCNHPDFFLKENTITLGKSAKIIQMPKIDDWYDTDPIFEFPIGEKKEYANSRRRLYRRDSPYIGLVSRDYYGGFVYGNRRYVFCGYLPSGRLGVFGVKGKPVKHKHEWETTCKICGVKK